ncbi:MAG: hypothetical protein A4E35_01203 [Methanoregula sp. PtaU1.Bin051]|nr:MAG: hypothetical protein A4E35_01203 [Methanoregula sp. PtaU1.Bin051]
MLNIMGILFGFSMLLPGLVPGMAVAVILFANGILLFMLAYNLNYSQFSARTGVSAFFTGFPQ